MLAQVQTVPVELTGKSFDASVQIGRQRRLGLGAVCRALGPVGAEAFAQGRIRRTGRFQPLPRLRGDEVVVALAVLLCPLQRRRRGGQLAGELLDRLRHHSRFFGVDIQSPGYLFQPR